MALSHFFRILLAVKAPGVKKALAFGTLVDNALAIASLGDEARPAFEVSCKNQEI